MRVLVAPDKFRGTLTAGQAAEAMLRGWRRARPDDDVDLAPMADGGDGTLEVLLGATGGAMAHVRVSGPLGDPVEASFGIVQRADGRTGMVEMASASGQALVAPARLNPWRTSTRGTGELIKAALDRGADRIVVCLGGSATNEGGAGMAQALGAGLLDANGREIAPGAGALRMLARIDLSTMDPRVRLADVVGACDVDNPLCGPKGASRVFGQQKGASADDLAELDLALAHLAAVANHDLGVDLRDEPGAGAAGGLGFGLMAFCGARLRRGAELVMDAVKLEERVARADVILTGEGSFDPSSLSGKVPGFLMELAAIAGKPIAVICGRAELRPEGTEIVSLEELVGRERAVREAAWSVVDAAAALAERAARIREGRINA